ncbi:ThiF family adenylyltransferase [Nocardia sp. BMG51109]|uniref:ThiF family adenylyltransferase n=1 Tax=Nocardia sp. BMG51109 TaxID=1056816 RepID=UPI0004657E64|nr:ThiF family adenylyltransferase [Nocardia sp. BMG51109]
MIEILHPDTDANRIAALLRPESGYRLVDAWPIALPELAVMDRPALAAGTPEADRRLAAYVADAHADGRALDRVTRYVVYPWRRTVVRLPDPEHFRRLRTARNRVLVTSEEQQRWSTALIGVAGLSVGAAALTTCALTGASRFRIADADVLGCTNLNRLVASVCDLGEPKLTLAHRRVLELDPYSEIAGFPGGYTPRSADEFFGRTDRLTVLIEEMDDFAMKVDIRLRARSRGIPVVMATDHGDNAFLDVERFDLDPEYPLWHGKAAHLAHVPSADLRDRRRRQEFAAAIVGGDITTRTRDSLAQIGRTLPSWPQLGTAASLAGVLAALAARYIACGGTLPSGRYRVDVDDILRGADG